MRSGPFEFFPAICLAYQPATDEVVMDRRQAGTYPIFSEDVCVSADYNAGCPATLNDPGDDEDVEIEALFVNGVHFNASLEVTDRLAELAWDHLDFQAAWYESIKEERAEARRKGEL